MSSFNKRKAVKEKTHRSKQQVVELDELLLDQDKPTPSKAKAEQSLLLLPPTSFYVDDQVRKNIDPHEIEQRAASMRANGQIQAIVVYPADRSGKNKGKHKIDKGECRWRAAQLIEGFELKAIIDPDAPKRNKRKRIVGQIVENDQRADLQPLEMAQALEELLADGMTQEEVAKELGWITRSKKPNINKVSRILSIMKLPEEGKKIISDGVVTDLITLEFLRKVFEVNPNKFSALCDLAREDNGLSRKRAEQEFKQCKANENSKEGSDSKQQGEAEEFSHERTEAEQSKAVNPDVIESQQAQASGYSNTSSQADSSNDSDKSEVDTSNETTEQTQTASAKGKLPTIRVEWQGIGEGVLIYDKTPEKEGFTWIKLDKGGDLISAELDDLKIKAVTV
jgi:ParB/RepB/Spo0J family partition protein